MDAAGPRDAVMAALAKQEDDCILPAFDETTAWALGLALHAAALARSAPVVIDIRTADRILFHVALPGATPDNEHWARRKSNVALRYHQSSMRVAESFRLKGKTIEAAIGVDPLEFAAHGGSVPVRVRGVGVVAAITCSGLASADDHALIVDVLAAHLAALAA